MFSFLFLFLVVYTIQSRMFETQIFLYIVMEAFFILYCCNQHLQEISSKASVLIFTLRKLRSIISQPSQNRPRLRCFSSFLKNLFNYTYLEQACVLSILFQQAPAGCSDILTKQTRHSTKTDLETLPEEKDLFATVVNEEPKNVHSCLKMLILDLAKFLVLSMKSSKYNFYNVTQNCYEI